MPGRQGGRNADRRAHRCGRCGGWLYSTHPCITCTIADAREVAARHDRLSA